MFIAACILAGLLLCDLLVHLIAIRLALPMFERPPPLNAEQFQADPRAETFTFVSEGGITLAGCLYHPAGPSRGVILFCPEFGSNRWSSLAYVEALAEAGFTICAFDFANQGESGHRPDYEPLHWFTEFEVQDILAALDYIRNRADLQDLPLGLFGVSRGGCAALAAAARRREVLGVASDGAFSAQTLMVHYFHRWALLYLPLWVLKKIPLWHIHLTMSMLLWVSSARRRCRYVSLERALRKLRHKPLQMISGERDTYIQPDATYRLASYTGQPVDRVWIVPGAKHNGCRKAAPEEYDRRLVLFFSGALVGEAVLQFGP